MLASAGVKRGIDRSALVRLITEPIEKPEPIALGTPPTLGTPARLEFVVPLFVGDKPNSSGVSVVAGATLARRIPPEAGKPGVDVCGEPIPALEATDLLLSPLASEGAEAQPNLNRIVAARNGVAFWVVLPETETGERKGQIVVREPAVTRRELRGHPHGYFELRGERGNVTLLVDGPGPGGRPVEFDTVIRMLDTWPLDERDEVLVEETVKASQWIPAVVGRVAPQHISPDDSFALKYDDESELVYVFPWDNWQAPPVSIDQMRSVLNTFKVTYGVRDATLTTLEKGMWNRPTVVARLGQVRVKADSIEDAQAQGATIIGDDPANLEVKVERTERSGMLGLGKKSIYALVSRRKDNIQPEHGAYEIVCRRGVCVIAVTRPRHGGNRVNLEDVMAEVRSWPFDACDDGAIGEAVGGAKGVPIEFARIVPAPSGDPHNEITEESPVAVKFSASKEVAYLFPWGQFPAEAPVEESNAALERAGVVAGVDEAALARIAETPLRRPEVVARGQPPARGEDAKLEYAFDSIKVEPPPAEGSLFEAPVAKSPLKVPPKALEGGRVDYRELGEVPTVQPGTVLVKKSLPKPGQDGYSITGEVLVSEAGDDIDLSKIAGQNTEVSGDGLELRATIIGQPTRVGDKIAVMPLHIIDGDVDFRTGNVVFDGNVMVRGDVRPGFRIRTTGTLQVMGVAEACILEAGGNIEVAGGIVGQSKSTVRAGGYVRVAFINAANVRATGTVAVDSEILHSTITSDDWVKVNGRIVGGQIRAKRGVATRVLGATTGTPTRVQTGWEAKTDQGKQEPGEAPVIVVHHEVKADVYLWIRGATLKIEETMPGTMFQEVDGDIVGGASWGAQYQERQEANKP